MSVHPNNAPHVNSADNGAPLNPINGTPGAVNTMGGADTPRLATLGQQLMEAQRAHDRGAIARLLTERDAILRVRRHQEGHCDRGPAPQYPEALPVVLRDTVPSCEPPLFARRAAHPAMVKVAACAVLLALVAATVIACAALGAAAATGGRSSGGDGAGGGGGSVVRVDQARGREGSRGWRRSMGVQTAARRPWGRLRSH